MIRLVVFYLLLIGAGGVRADAVHITRNFVVTAPDARLAARVAYDAEAARVRFARVFLRREPADSPYPHPIILRSPRPGLLFPEEENGLAKKLGGVINYLEFVSDSEAFFEEIISHEVCHLMMAEEMGGDYGTRWFGEGMAVYFETLDRGYPKRLGERVGLSPLVDFLDRDDFSPEHKFPYTYGQAYSVVRYLMDTYGDAVWDFHAASRAVGVETACLRVFNISVEQLDADWRASLSSMTSPYPLSLRGR